MKSSLQQSRLQSDGPAVEDTTGRDHTLGFGARRPLAPSAIIVTPPTTLPRIYLIRHGETEWFRLGRHTSETDLPLLPSGETDAGELKSRLSPIAFNHALCSPRRRARRTCELAGFSAVAEIDAELSEWNYGDDEGKTAAEIVALRPGWTIYRDGCPNGESAEEVSLRADRVVSRLRSLTGNVALFSHGHFLRILTARWLGWPLAHAQSLLLSTASLSILAFNHGRVDRPVIALWNDLGPGNLQ